MADGSALLIVGLAELARQVRRGTIELLDATNSAALTWTPPGTSNHILWHAGHALWLQDALSVQPLTGRSELPKGWVSMFGQHSAPATISDWPDDAEVCAHLDGQLRRIQELLSQHAERIATDANKKSPQCGWPLLAGMIHGWHDEARHQGEMYLLYKLAQAR
jgi:hypothetical protein